MASRTITLLKDDIDGSDATQTVRFALDGVEYEIDLSDRNANRLRNSFEEFVRHARKVGGGAGRKAPSVRADDSLTGSMREWLREYGYKVSDRGRIPGWLQQVYQTVIELAPRHPREKLVTISSLWPPSNVAFSTAKINDASDHLCDLIVIKPSGPAS